ncbi:MAG TPA: hypothetical protein VJ847_08220 [Gemmatimonadales bacterium]|jgi:hypothetical protein|nr:hypothetical protein [Gemmatimonadales bacterium]
MHRITAAATCLLAGLAACGNPNDLADATIPNVESTVTLSALTGTPIATPSAYSVAEANAVRTDQGAAFDFAFNIDPAGRAVFLPLAVLGLGVTGGTNAGFLATDQAFESITSAPLNGYVTADTIPVQVGQHYIVRSRVVCSGLGVPKYGKMEITAIDPSPGVRTITFRVLTDDNCGYRGLDPGIPTE